MLWILSGDAFAFEKKLMETQSTVGVEGRIWAMDEIPSPPLPLPASPSGAATVKTIAPPLAVTQHMESPRNFVIVNAQGKDEELTAKNTQERYMNFFFQSNN